MSSSTSSFDGQMSAPWRSWLAILALAPVVFAGLCFITIVIDPFSIGRYSPITRVDYAVTDILWGHAGRARDPSFNAAIAGNSHALAYDPGRLTAATGLRFAQLSSLGLNPSETLTIAAAFARGHRARTHAVVLILDETWCAADIPTNRIKGFFPAFLFESSPGEYLRGMMSGRAVDAAGYRLLLLAGIVGDRQRRDGYAPIRFSDAGWTAEQLASFAHRPRPFAAPAPEAPIPALDLLRARAPEFEAETRLILQFNPLPYFSLPVAGSPAERRLGHCKNQFREFAARRPLTAFIDRLQDDAFANDMRNFGDITHIHTRVAPFLEQDIISALSSLNSQRPVVDTPP